MGNLRKALLIVGTIALNSQFQLTQTIYIFTVLYASHGLFKYLKPFSKPYINNVDLVGTTVSMVTLLSATVFDESNAEAIEAGEGNTILLYVLIFFGNIFFLIIWSFYIIKVIIQKI